MHPSQLRMRQELWMISDLAGSVGYEQMVACLNKPGIGADGHMSDYFVAPDAPTVFDAAGDLSAHMLDLFEHFRYTDHVAAAD